jgi:hypothetical protein
MFLDLGNAKSDNTKCWEIALSVKTKRIEKNLTSEWVCE